MGRTSSIVAWLCCAMLSVPLLAQQASLSVAAGPKTLTVTNATPRGEVILVGVAIRSENGARVLRRFAEVLRDDDGDGRVELTPPGHVPRRSVWAAIDLDTGAFATAAGQDYDFYLLAIPETVLKKDSGGFIDGVEHATVELDAVVVRPKSGAWRRHAAELWENDEDNAVNGKVATRFAAAIPLAAAYGNAPAKLKKDDVVVLVDIRHLQIGVTKVTQ